VFRVRDDASKAEVKQAVELMFEVNSDLLNRPEDAPLQEYGGKRKRFKKAVCAVCKPAVQSASTLTSNISSTACFTSAFEHRHARETRIGFAFSATVAAFPTRAAESARSSNVLYSCRASETLIQQLQSAHRRNDFVVFDQAHGVKRGNGHHFHMGNVAGRQEQFSS